MSNSTNPRIVRKHFPPRALTRTGYRQAHDYLVKDFADRCAYSMQHSYRAGGKLEVDHHDPRRKNDPIQKYTNMFPASRHCNGAKRDRWPKYDERQQGIRFLNCCEEMDYGVHILEDPDTHELVGVTPAGKYHVRNCDLNAPHLVEERTSRAELWPLIQTQVVTLKANLSLPDAGIIAEKARAMRTEVEKMIPPIPYLSGKELEKRRSLRKAVAALLDV